jgi:hypothetical protein
MIHVGGTFSYKGQFYGPFIFLVVNECYVKEWAISGFVCLMLRGTFHNLYEPRYPDLVAPGHTFVIASTSAISEESVDYDGSDF